MPVSDRDLGLFYLNGDEFLWVDFPLLIGTNADDSLQIDARAVTPSGANLVRAHLGAGDDTITGDAAAVHGGGGHDLFLNRGVDGREASGYSRTFGGQGNDTFIDFYGSTRYFGGLGQDLFTNYFFPTTHANPYHLEPEWQDHDIVNLGLGRDTAHWQFSVHSGGDEYGGLVLEPRRADISGGLGVDLLSLEMINGRLPIYEGDSIDFREITTGSMTIGIATFSSFERFHLSFGDSTLDNVHLGNRADVLIWFDTEMEDATPFDVSFVPDRVPDGPLRIYGNGGADFIVGSYYRDEEFLFGGNGNDTISSGGSGQGGDTQYLFGGRGHDVLYAGGVPVSHAHTVFMRGGAGADHFVVASHGADVRVRDFEQGVDRLVLDFTGNYSLYESGHRDVVPEWRNLTVLADDDAQLQFEFTYDRGYSSFETMRVTYDRASGEVFLLGEIIWDDGGPLGERVAVLNHAPDLSIEDFSLYTWDTFSFT